MQTGGFSGQKEALEQRIEELAREKASAQSSRRMFVGLAVGGLFGACAGGGTVHALGTESPAPESSDSPQSGRPADPALDPLRALAEGPLVELVDRAAFFLTEADRFPEDDEVLWLGVARLAAVMAEQPGRVSRLSGRMSLVARLPNAPPHVRSWVALINKQHR